MNFATALALLIGLLVAAPVVAHMLRRRRAEEQMFAPARLVPSTPPVARRRSFLEDRALFAARALSVVALALLGATPFVRCSRLSVGRPSGANVALALLIDDSMSMRAPYGEGKRAGEGKSRFDRALSGARELLDDLQPGDAVAIVLAGAPARVRLLSTTNLAAARAALDALEVSDRATDLDGALQLSQDLLRGLVQPDKRIVVLSDLADGQGEGAKALAVRPEDKTVLWAPLPEIAGLAEDCALVRADRAGRKVTVRVVCEGGQDAAVPAGSAQPALSSPSEGRVLELRSDKTLVVSAPLSASLRAEEIALELPEQAPDALWASLTGRDAIAENDRAPVMAAHRALSLAIVSDTASAQIATGGPPPIEQAAAALGRDVLLKPLPLVPEHAGDFDAYEALIVDDAPGFTPEVRSAMAAWVEHGGCLLLTLGPKAASAPLGAGFEPLIPGVVRYAPSPSDGIDVSQGGFFGAAAGSLTELEPRGRASLDSADAEVLAKLVTAVPWSDGAPFLLRRNMGRGMLLVLTLPFGTDESDLALRPAFLVLLDRFLEAARTRGGRTRIDAGETWAFDGFGQVVVRRLSEGPADALPLPVQASDGRPRVTPSLSGLYELSLDGERSRRVVSIPEREVTFKPRAVQPSAGAGELGGVVNALDISPMVALALLALLAAELGLRTLSQAQVKPAPPPAPTA